MKKFYYSNGDFYAIVAAPSAAQGLAFLSERAEDTGDIEPYSLYREEDMDEDEDDYESTTLISAGGEGATEVKSAEE